MAQNLEFFGVMSELGAGTRGASLGLEALKITSLQYDQAFFLERKVQSLPTENHRLHLPPGDPSALRLEGIRAMYLRIEDSIGQSLESGNFPVVIAGDHSNAGGTIAGIKKAHPDKRLGVIWVDAHADMHSPYTSPSGNVHGMPLATALGEDNFENKVQEPKPATLEQWTEMKGNNQRLLPSDLFFFGVRDTEDPEQALRSRFEIPNLTVAEVREMGLQKAAQQAFDHLQDCDLIYLSFDVDSMDPSVSVGTGTPVDKGFLEEEAAGLLQELIKHPKLCCFEMVEINPLLDLKGNSMAEAAFRIFKPLIEYLEKA